LGCRLAVDGDLVAPALGGDVLPMTAIEPAAIGEVAAMEYPMQLRLRAATVVEAVTLPDKTLVAAHLLPCQAPVLIRPPLAHRSGFAVVAVVDWIAGIVPENDEFERLVLHHHRGEFLDQLRCGAEPRLKTTMPLRHFLMLEQSLGSQLIDRRDNGSEAVGRPVVSLAFGIESRTSRIRSEAVTSDQRLRNNLDPRLHRERAF